MFIDLSECAKSGEFAKFTHCLRFGFFQAFCDLFVGFGLFSIIPFNLNEHHQKPFVKYCLTGFDDISEMRFYLCLIRVECAL